MNREQIAEMFNARAEGYAHDDWHQRYAGQFVDVTPLREGDRVMDAGTGTGFAACAIARRVGPAGHVVGVDLSSRMLEQARRVAAAAHLSNVEFLEADVSDLHQIAAASFNAVVCSAGLLYMPVAISLREWRRLLRPDGVVAFSTMKAGSPASGRIFRKCAARFGIDLKDRSEPLGTEDRCRQVLEEAGFDPLQVIAGQVDFPKIDTTLAWEANFRAAGPAGRALSAEEQDMLRRQFLEELQREVQADPVAAARADAIFAIGRRTKND
jgi:ubiquinone/menaquinone biosynthesis C-methylase UbiE